MNKLQKFLDQYGSVELAKQLGVSESAVSHWRNGRHHVSPSRCRQIEKLSGGSVTAIDLRPDIFGPSPSEAA